MEKGGVDCRPVISSFTARNRGRMLSQTLCDHEAEQVFFIWVNY